MAVSGSVVVVGLGPGHRDLVTSAARRALDEADVVVLRTRRHPACDDYPSAIACDDIYDSAADLDAAYNLIVDRVVSLALSGQRVAYAVPGSVAVAESTVRRLRDHPGVDTRTVDGVSFVELAWSRLGIDPFEHGVRLVDAHRFAEQAAGATGPLLVGQCDSVSVLSDIKLSADGGPDVTFLQRLGLPEEAIVTVPWSELDRSVTVDHLTSLFVPGRGPDLGASIVRLDELVRRLRADCPWDRRQTHTSLVTHLVEETYELVDAIDEFDPDDAASIEALAEELGDVAFQVVFHAVLASEQGLFDLASVLEDTHDKLVSRHPHVFAADPSGGSAGQADADLVASWERRKLDEKGRTSIVDGIATNLPALALAAKAVRKARTADVRLPAPNPEVAVLWSAVEAAVAAGADPEHQLRSAARDALDAIRASGA